MVNKQPHIRCDSNDAAKYAIMPGDIGRVEKVMRFLDDPRDIAFNREFKSCTGFYKGVKVMVISTGIGGPSTAIAVEELKNIGVETLIRIGSCGALKEGIRLGDLIIASGAVRDEGTSKSYVKEAYPAVPTPELLIKLIESAKDQKFSYHCGIVRSHDGLYSGDEDKLDKYWGNKGAIGSDMETAALFVVGALRNLNTASVLNVVVESNGKVDSGINNYVEGETLTIEGERKEILTVLEAIVKLEKI